MAGMSFYGNQKNILSYLIFFLITICFIIPPFISYFVGTPYIKFLILGLNVETCTLLLISFLLNLLFLNKEVIVRKEIKMLISVVVVVFYLMLFRLYNVDFSMLCIIAYINCFFFLGSFDSSIDKIGIEKLGISICNGMVFYVLFALLLSFINCATSEFLILTTFIVTIISILSKKTLIHYYLSKRDSFHRFSRASKWEFALFFTVFVILILQTNNNPTFDESWYSLRTHQLLNRDGSFFETFLYPDNWVVYYPKFFEVLSFPLQISQNFGLSKMFSVFIWLLTFPIVLLLVSNLKREFNDRRVVLLALTIMALPVLGNMAINTKGDILSLYFFLNSFLIATNYRNSGLFSEWLLAFGFAIISITARISAVPFVGFLIIWLFYLWISNFNRTKYDMHGPSHKVIQFFLALIILYLFMYRTYINIGVPIVQLDKFPLVTELYKLFGWHYNEYFDYAEGSIIDKSSFLKILFFSIFDPYETRAAPCWYSNYYLLIFFFILTKSRAIFSKKVNVDSELILSILIMISMWLIIGLFFNDNYGKVGGDGNYYIVPIVLISSIYSKYFLKYFNGIYYCLILFVSFFTFHFVLTYISGKDWDPGIKNVELDFKGNPIKGKSNKEYYKNRTISRYHLQDIISYLPDEPNTYLAGNSHAYNLYFLGRSYLDFRSMERTRRSVFKDYNTFIKFLGKGGINYLLISNFPNNSLCYKYSRLLVQERDIISRVGLTYTLIDLSNFRYLSSLSDDVIRNNESEEVDTAFNVSNPKLLDSPSREDLPAWLKPLQMTDKDLYYWSRIVLLSNHSSCEFRFSISETSDAVVQINFASHYLTKTMPGHGNLEIMITGKGGALFTSNYDIDQTEVFYKEIILPELEKGNYRIILNFDSERWKNWARLAIRKPIVILK